ncbi:MAG: DNA polymerase III subunit delta [Butyribacter sp.]
MKNCSKKITGKNLKHFILENSDEMNFSKFENRGIDLSEVQSIADTLPFSVITGLLLFRTVVFLKHQMILRIILSICLTVRLLFLLKKRSTRRNKLYKYVNKNGIAAEIKLKDAQETLNWAARRLKDAGKVFTRQTMEYFLQRVDNNLYSLSNEIDKLVAYTGDRQEVTIADIDEICPAFLQNHIFQMVDAVGASDADKALKLYNELIELKEAPSYILYMLIRHFNILLQISSLGGAAKNEIAAKIGISPYFVGNYQRQAAGFKREQLKNALESSLDTEQKFKTGILDDQIGVELLIVGLVSR